MHCTILLPTQPVGIKRPLSISLPTQSRQIVSNANLDLCIFDHQFSALKNTGISSRHSSFSTRKNKTKHISFIYKPKLAGKFSPTYSSPTYLLFLNAAEKQWKESPDQVLVLASSLPLTSCWASFTSHLYLPPLARYNVEQLTKSDLLRSGLMIYVRLTSGLPLPVEPLSCFPLTATISLSATKGQLFLKTQAFLAGAT